MEDSGPATQTQKAVTDAITKNTLSMIGYALHRLLAGNVVLVIKIAMTI